MKNIDFNNKRVLDVGCRDGLFSFEAENLGAIDIIGIDNDISKGTTEVLIPAKKSKVQMHELNLYDLTPEKFGMFDVIIFFGVLYHLRYPMWGLRKLTDCLSDGGILIIESGMLVDESLKNLDILYCPVEDSPYEETSCTFFNERSLTTTLHSFKLELLNCWTFNPNQIEETPQKPIGLIKKFTKRVIRYLARKSGLRVDYRKDINCAVERQVIMYKKNNKVQIGLDKVNKRLNKAEDDDAKIRAYWDKTHNIHTKMKDNPDKH